MMDTYLIKANVSLIATYLLYLFVFRNRSSPHANRLILVFGSLCAMVLPLIDFEFGSSVYSFESVGALVESKLVTPATQSLGNSDYSLDIYSIVYMTGAILLALRSIVGLATLLYYYFTFPKLKKWGFQVVEVNSSLSPSTFFNLMFVGSGVSSSLDLRAIIAHERVHKTQFHSFDVLLLELLTIVMWFNPISWLIKKEIKLSHEFIADHEVLKSGIGLLDYQQLLFQVCSGGTTNWVSQLSNKSNLEKRFKMMNKLSINSKKSHSKVFMAVPIIVLFVTLCSFNAMNQPDVLPMYKQGTSAMYKTLGDNLFYAANARSENRQGTVFVTFRVSASGEVQNVQVGKKSDNSLEEIVVVGFSKTNATQKDVGEELQKAAIEAVESLDQFKPAEKNGEPVLCELTLPVKFTLK